MNAKDKSTTKPYQIKMDKEVHGLLKRRAKDMGMTIGEFIQNMLSSFEHRLSQLKERNELENVFGADEWDAKLLKLLFFKDARKLSEDDIKFKIENMKEDFLERGKYRPELTIKDDSV